jgi:hypothetical protein
MRCERSEEYPVYDVHIPIPLRLSGWLAVGPAKILHSMQRRSVLTSNIKPRLAKSQDLQHISILSFWFLVEYATGSDSYQASDQQIIRPTQESSRAAIRDPPYNEDAGHDAEGYDDTYERFRIVGTNIVVRHSCELFTPSLWGRAFCDRPEGRCYVEARLCRPNFWP